MSFSLAAYDDAGLLYAQRQPRHPSLFPARGQQSMYKTLQIPTTLPTLDELLGRPEYPEASHRRRITCPCSNRTA